MESRYDALVDLINLAGEDYVDNYDKISEALNALLILVKHLRKTTYGTIVLDSDRLSVSESNELRGFLDELEHID